MTRKVLIIDDDPTIRRLVQIALERSGYDVIQAADGEEGRQMITTERPDAVLVDLSMPKLDGQSLCRLTDPLKADRPFLTVVISGSTAEEEHEWAAELVDTCFIGKPFSPTAIIKCVDDYFALAP